MALLLITISPDTYISMAGMGDPWLQEVCHRQLLLLLLSILHLKPGKPHL